MDLKLGVDILKIKNNITNQYNALTQLLDTLEEQYECIVKNDVYKMEECVEKIQTKNQLIANLELERRNIFKSQLKENTMTEIINEIQDEELNGKFKSIKVLINELILQKDTNELLIKQGLGYTNKMLMILNPDRQAKTYNSYGKVR